MQFVSIYEECGVFAIQNHKDAVHKSLLGLHALQHRGQESFGIVASDSKELYSYHSKGHVNSAFSDQAATSLCGNTVIGHVRYSTSGADSFKGLAVQPFTVESKYGKIAVAHNGNITNAHPLREMLLAQGCKFSSDIDTEVIAHLVALQSASTFPDSVISAVQEVKGAYSLVFLDNNLLMGVRDPAGIRPLVLGMVDGSYVLASETCALDIVKAEFVRNIQPGELVLIDRSNNLTSVFPFKQPTKSSFCIFEYIYFARPDSIVEGISTYNARKNIGAELAVESPPPENVDIVVPVPDSGIPAAMGYSIKSGVPFEFGIIRNHYSGRTFIQPTQQSRKSQVELKHNANSSVLRGKNIVLVDDSIVRGTTLREVIALLKNAGTKEIHLKISSPPTKYPCFYGIDTPSQSSLISNNFSQEELPGILDCSSVSFISINGLYRAIRGEDRRSDAPQYCDACFTGLYPAGVISHSEQR